MSQAYVMSEKCRMFMIDTLRFGYICHSKFISENTININKKKIKKEKIEKEMMIVMLDVEAKVTELEIIISESYILQSKGKAVL